GELRHKGSPWFLALTAIGVVFGDIGTSPLYTLSVTLSATGHTVPTAVDVLGIISLIFWALDGVAQIRRAGAARRQRRRRRNPGAVVAGGANYQWPGHPDPGPARHRGRGAALWRRRH